jgi:hypothetical protein
MTQDHPVNAPGIEGEARVEGMGFSPATLKESGVQQNPRSSRLEQVHGAGDLPRATPERDTGCGH